MSSIEEIFKLVIEGEANIIADAVNEVAEAGEDPNAILNDGMIAAMNEIGERYTKGEVFVPEMMVAARAMKNGVTALKPYLSEAGTTSTGTAVIGTVAGDLHDIGKNLVLMMLESTGLEVIDLGCDVSAESFVAAVKNNPNITLVCCSALLTTTMAGLKDTVVAFEEAGLRDQVKVLVGGAPVSQDFCDEIGADGYGSDAAAAVKLAKEFIAV